MSSKADATRPKTKRTKLPKAAPALLAVVGTLAAVAAPAHAAENRVTLVAQSDYDAKQGFFIDFENAGPGAAIPLSGLKLVLGIGDGKTWTFLSSSPDWQLDHDYSLDAKITPTESTLTLDGQQVNGKTGGYLPHAGSVEMNTVEEWASATTAYAVLPVSLTITSGTQEPVIVTFPASAAPTAANVFNERAARYLDYPVKPGETVEIAAVFRLTAPPDLHAFAPYIDTYGQFRGSDWADRVHRDADLKAQAESEAAALSAVSKRSGYDPYGGWKKAGWSEDGTGYFRTVKRDGFWWLITPDGNPCFYVGLCSAPSLFWDVTPVTGREYLFDPLPRKGPLGAAWSKNEWGIDDGTEYYSFTTANLIRKHGKDWRERARKVTLQRMKAWRFSGLGKWGDLSGEELLPKTPSTPVLEHTDVPDVGRHPDIFDPMVQAALKKTLTKQILPHRDDPTSSAGRWATRWTSSSQRTTCARFSRQNPTLPSNALSSTMF